MHSKVLQFIKLLLIFNIHLFCINVKAQDLTLEEGNHTWAQSESWTWMGHLNECENINGVLTLKNNGIALIHYYTRNKTQFGNLNFKSSALTFTQNGIGKLYDKATIYSDFDEDEENFQLKIRENKLHIEFKSNNKIDIIKKLPITNTDIEFIQNKLLPHFPGLKIRENFIPAKYKFTAFVGSKSYLNLDLFQIWPSFSPPYAKMKFLGIKDSYTFSQPMLVAVGRFFNHGIQKSVLGLMFLDRQWSKEYFGKNILENPLDILEQNQALLYAHNWSAFHAHSDVSHNWYFVHLWQQFQRQENLYDTHTDYTGIVWVKNGIPQNPISRNLFEWKGFDFIKNDSDVLLNYAAGRESYFPTQYYFHNKINSDQLLLKASPKLQSLDQPIYLYEGFASGEGIWNSEKVQLQGRLESSRILFRIQDYKEIVNQTMMERFSKFTEKKEQTKLVKHLEQVIEAEYNCAKDILCVSDYFYSRIAHFDYIFNNLSQKLNILQSGFDNQSITKDPQDPTFVIYH